MSKQTQESGVKNPFSTFKPAIKSFSALFKQRMGVLPALFLLVKSIFYLLHKLISFLGLWAPLIYSLFGVILFFGFNFNPFDGDPNSALFITGFALCTVSTAVIAGKNLIIKPFLYISEKISGGQVEPLIEKEQEPEIGRKKKRVDASEMIRKKATGELKKIDERPQVYTSKLEPDLLIHEYSDRFEVFVVKNGKPHIDKIEYK